MKTVQISLNSIDKVKSFVNDITKFGYDFRSDLRQICHRCKIHHGIFSLDLPNLQLNIHADDLDEILEILKPYIIGK